jgi:hypothetical protein
VPVLSKTDVTEVSYDNPLPCAVDYKAGGGDAVYAYMPPCVSGSYRGEVTTDYSVCRKDHLITLYEVGPIPATPTSYYWRENYEDEDSYTYDLAVTRTLSLVTGRIELPWGVALQVLSEETSSVANSIVRTNRQFSNAEGTNTAGGSPNTLGLDGVIASRSGSNSFASYLATRSLAIWHLDLRNDVIVYSILEKTYTQASAIEPYGFSVDLDHIPVFADPDDPDRDIVVGSVSGTVSFASTGTLTTRVQVGTEIRAEAIASESDSDSNVVAFDMSNYDVVWGGDVVVEGYVPADPVALAIGAGQTLAQTEFSRPYGTLYYADAAAPTGATSEVADASQTLDNATSADFFQVSNFAIFFAGEFPDADFGWMHEIPLASIANPLQWGSWAVHRGVLCFSQPWPEGDFVTPGFKHLVGTRSLNDAAYAPNATSFAPIAALPKIAGI